MSPPNLRILADRLFPNLQTPLPSDELVSSAFIGAWVAECGAGSGRVGHVHVRVHVRVRVRVCMRDPPLPK